MFTSVVISGGAVKGISVLGCMRYLEEKGLLSGVRNYVGTSAGSIVCLFMVLGFKHKEVRKFLIESLNDESIRTFDMEKALDMLTTFGLTDGSTIEEIFRRALYKKVHVREMTFLELAKATGKNLVVCAANMTKETHEFFSVDTTPMLSVVTAIRASCSLPLMFQPVKINDDMYIDGALYNNFPIDYFKDTHLRDILGIHIAPSKVVITNIFTFFLYLINSVINKVNKKDYNNPDLNIVTIDIEDQEWFSLDTMQLQVSADTIDAYMEKGYRAIEDRLQVLQVIYDK